METLIGRVTGVTEGGFRFRGLYSGDREETQFICDTKFMQEIGLRCDTVVALNAQLIQASPRDNRSLKGLYQAHKVTVLFDGVWEPVFDAMAKD